MKKFFLALMAVFMCAVSAQAEIYTYDTSEDIMNGVTLRHIQRFYGSGWLNITAVAADLSNPRLQLDLLKGGGVDSLTSMAGLTSGRSDVVAATNADFFDNTRPAYSQGFSLGIEYKGGELLQSQIDESMAAGFYDGRRLRFDYMTMSMTLTAPDGQTRRIAHLNKHTDYYGDILMYTSDWNNGWSPAPGGDVAEIVVEDGVITEYRRELPPVKIPENGCVFAVSESVEPFFSVCYKVGDPIGFNLAADPSLEGIKTAFGGGTLLLKDGQKTGFTHIIAGTQPRTCVGTNADGTVVYLITVDGRQAASKGATMSELADIALELGCANAMNLDGGGSTRMLARSFWSDGLSVANMPTENRKVINALAVTTDAVPGEAVGVRLKSGGAVLAGDSIAVESRLYDENGLPTTGPEPEFTVTGADGQVAGGRFYPLSPGAAMITASCGGEPSEPVTVRVMDRITDIDVPQLITLKVGESYELTPTVSDLEGSARVENITLLSPTVGNSQYAALNGRILTALAPGYSTLTLSRDGVSAHTLIKVDEPVSSRPELPAENITDPAMGTVPGGSSFGVFAFVSSKNTLLNSLLYRDGLRSIASSTSYGFLGGYMSEKRPADVNTPIKADTFSAFDKGFALIISLPANGRLTGANWLSMANALASTAARNVIVLTNADPNGSIAAETQVFYDYLDLAAQTKNVYIVKPGLANAVTFRGKVRVLTLADTSDYTDIPSALENAWVLRFTMNGEDCKYSFEKIYQ